MKSVALNCSSCKQYFRRHASPLQLVKYYQPRTIRPFSLPLPLSFPPPIPLQASFLLSPSTPRHRKSSGNPNLNILCSPRHSQRSRMRWSRRKWKCPRNNLYIRLTSRQISIGHSRLTSKHQHYRKKHSICVVMDSFQTILFHRMRKLRLTACCLHSTLVLW